ncbi:MAG: SpoIVB peptidase [Ruminococcus sp.]|jgi:stage IV sporulation protein B|nr:SpoIVB peptidase [Ruminococcus sp.]
MNKIIKKFSISFFLLTFAVWTISLYYANSLPDSFYVQKGTELTLNTRLNIIPEKEKIVPSDISNSNKISPKTVTLKLWGAIPLKEVEVMSVDTPVLMPGGSPFGIKLLMEGVMVIRLDDVDGAASPARNSGIEVGDIIIRVNGQKVGSNNEIKAYIKHCNGEPIPVELKRNGDTKTLLLTPEYSVTGKRYEAGMWVRDSSAGVGTVTFYEPSTDSFGGLGHPVCDVDTGEIIPVSGGEVAQVEITGVVKGEKGIPGELSGRFTGNKSIGKITKNNRYGIFGKLYDYDSGSEPIPMALKQEIHEGAASIITTLDGENPKEYSIEIEKIDYKASESTKNMVIKITDSELLSKAGGIVQGMSGSPIIQDGKLIGAVTHVFVNNPAKGYGIFAENMYELGLN